MTPKGGQLPGVGGQFSRGCSGETRSAYGPSRPGPPCSRLVEPLRAVVEQMAINWGVSMYVVNFDAVDALLALEHSQALDVLHAVRTGPLNNAPPSARSQDNVSRYVVQKARDMPGFTDAASRTVFIPNTPLVDVPLPTPPRPDLDLPKHIIPVLLDLTAQCGPVLKYAVRQEGTSATDHRGRHGFFEFATPAAYRRCIELTMLCGRKVSVRASRSGRIAKGFTLGVSARAYLDEHCQGGGVQAGGAIAAEHLPLLMMAPGGGMHPQRAPAAIPPAPGSPLRTPSGGAAWRRGGPSCFAVHYHGYGGDQVGVQQLQQQRRRQPQQQQQLQQQPQYRHQRRSSSSSSNSSPRQHRVVVQQTGRCGAAGNISSVAQQGQYTAQTGVAIPDSTFSATTAHWEPQAVILYSVDQPCAAVPQQEAQPQLLEGHHQRHQDHMHFQPQGQPAQQHPHQYQHHDDHVAHHQQVPHQHQRQPYATYFLGTPEPHQPDLGLHQQQPFGDADSGRANAQEGVADAGADRPDVLAGNLCVKIQLRDPDEPVGISTMDHGSGGVRITAVQPGSAAERAGLVTGHIITRAAGILVGTVEEFTAIRAALHRTQTLSFDVAVEVHSRSAVDDFPSGGGGSPAAAAASDASADPSMFEWVHDLTDSEDEDDPGKSAPPAAAAAPPAAAAAPQVVLAAVAAAPPLGAAAPVVTGFSGVDSALAAFAADTVHGVGHVSASVIHGLATGLLTPAEAERILARVRAQIRGWAHLSHPRRHPSPGGGGEGGGGSPLPR
eukprot:TRINITY_DN3110_c0_g1_i6.p1 TRINITY_DN3110_c0_g1~~TRINITY_DN3110_c0_g1_i6.p1  ORF type:complete len:809 (+),score=161.65 TRINITY_DN3110_c0_g1_i6:100-2427(+)